MKSKIKIKWLQNNRTRAIFILIIVILICLIPIGINSSYLMENPFDTSYPMDFPSYAIMDIKQNVYVIDQSKQRIIKLREDGTSVFNIKGGRRESTSFYTAVDIVVDAFEYIYVTDVMLSLDGSAIEKERIIKYNPDGVFDSVIYEISYPVDQRPIARGRIQALTLVDNGLQFIYTEKNSFSLEYITFSQNKKTTLLTIPYETSDLVSFAISKSIYCVTKTGNILKVNITGEIKKIYCGEEYNTKEFFSIPWNITIDHQEAIYFTDIGLRRIMMLDHLGKLHTIIQRKDLTELRNNTIYYNISISPNGDIITTDLDSIMIQKPTIRATNTINTESEPKIVNTIQYTTSYIIKRSIIVALSAIVILLSLCLIKLFAQYRIHISISEMAKHNLIILVVTTIVSGFVFSLVMNNMQDRYVRQVMNNMSSVAELIGNSLDSQDIKAINTPQDYVSESYQTIKDTIQKEFSSKNSWTEGLYCVLNKVDKNQIIYSCLYLEDTIGSVYPLDWSYKGSEYEQLYETKTQIKFDWIENTDGIWFYVLSPVFDQEGNVIAALEVGTNLYTFIEENNVLMRQMVLNVISLAAIIILLFSEFFCYCYYKKNSAETVKKEIELSILPIYFIRPIVFIIFMTDCMATAFLPMLARELAIPLWGIPAEIMSVIPISTEVLMTAIFSFLGGYLIDKINIRTMLLIGCCLLTCGLTMAGFSANIFLFIYAKAVIGMGVGLLLVATNTLIASYPDKERNLGFSFYNSGSLAGLTVGTSIGSFLVSSLGYTRVYLVAAILSALLLIIITVTLKKGIKLPSITNINKRHPNNKISTLQFILKKEVLIYLLCVLMPYLLCGYFLSYFMPLFAQSLEMEESAIGQLFLINGICVIYLGPTLTEYLLDKLKPKGSIFLAGGIYITTLLLFILYPSRLMIVLSALLFGIADSFGFSALLVYFSNLTTIKEYGGGKSMGIYSTFENIVQATGPFVFGFVFVLGIKKGILIIVVVYIALLFFFGLTKEYTNKQINL